MTEWEAKAYAVRLTRIWGSVSNFTMDVWDYGEADLGEAWYFNARLDSEFELQFYTHEWGDVPFIRLDYRTVEGERSIPLVCTSYDRKAGTVVKTPIFNERTGDPRIAQQCLVFFRRGCWLSGVDVEASAHEKAEWMQGFSREELEAWNLKM